jgi:chitinase
VGYADEYGDPRNLRGFRRRRADNPDVSMILSIGGFFASRYYSVAASDETRRRRFARTAIELMREYEFDGLNVDWQYPGGDNPNNFTDDEDIDRFTLLLQEVRRQLDVAGSEDDADYELSISAAINPEVTEQLDVAGFADAVDRVNVMAYDYTGPWERRTGFNAPLGNPFPEEAPDNPFTVSRAMEAWQAQPIDASKLILGFASYGRAFTGVPGTNRGFDQEYEGLPEGSVGGEEGTYTYHDILTELLPDNDYEYHWHDDAAAPFLYSAADDEFVTYENTRSVVEKARYVRDNEFGGMAMWDVYGDRDGVLLYMANSALGGE